MNPMKHAIRAVIFSIFSWQIDQLPAIPIAQPNTFPGDYYFAPSLPSPAAKVARWTMVHQDASPEAKIHEPFETMLDAKLKDFLTKTKMAQERACVHYIVFEARLLGAVGCEVLLQRFKGAQLKPCIDCSDTSASN